MYRGFVAIDDLEFDGARVPCECFGMQHDG